METGQGQRQSGHSGIGLDYSDCFGGRAGPPGEIRCSLSIGVNWSRGMQLEVPETAGVGCLILSGFGGWIDHDP